MIWITAWIIFGFMSSIGIMIEIGDDITIGVLPFLLMLSLGGFLTLVIFLYIVFHDVVIYKVRK